MSILTNAHVALSILRVKGPVGGRHSEGGRVKQRWRPCPLQIGALDGIDIGLIMGGSTVVLKMNGMYYNENESE